MRWLRSGQAQPEWGFLLPIVGIRIDKLVLQYLLKSRMDLDHQLARRSCPVASTQRHAQTCWTMAQMERGASDGTVNIFRSFWGWADMGLTFGREINDFWGTPSLRKPGQFHTINVHKMVVVVIVIIIIINNFCWLKHPCLMVKPC